MHRGLLSRCTPGLSRTDIDAELGVLRSRLGKRGRMLRRSATRLVVRFEGETALTRIGPPSRARSTLSMTVCSTLNTARHTLAART